MSNKDIIGMYPGTFDPVTFGHMDIIDRSAKIVDKLIIGVADSPIKGALLNPEERVSLMRKVINDNPDYGHVEVVGFSELLMEFARNNDVSVVFRGLRGTSDFDYEFQMAGMNTYLAQDIETIFLMATNRHQYIASKFVREVARLNSDVSAFVPEHVVEFLKDKFK